MEVWQHSFVNSRETTWRQAVQWAMRFDHVMIFDNQEIPFPERGFPKMILAGHNGDVFVGGGFSELNEIRSSVGSWLAGFLSYDLKNDIEKLSSNNDAFIPTPELTFFNPAHVLIFHSETVEVQAHSDPWDEITTQDATPGAVAASAATLELAPDKQQYLDNVEAIRNHILEGDIYEMNYCVEFGLSNVQLNPAALFQRLINRSPTPFSVFARFDRCFVLCASPERFLKKSGQTLISQPIKGTARRYPDAVADLHAKEALFTSEKERAENLMIVDLVRNDLARSCEIGSVHVPELFGIYSFEHWHQMISSVHGTLSDEVHETEAIRNAFPMGSMTGAPKIKVMELIDQYEYSKRGIYSGALGYFTPEGDFDFNVVIRSIIYDQKSSKLSFSVGSAITFDSDPALEYEECLLKASAILEVLREAGIAPPELINLP